MSSLTLPRGARLSEASGQARHRIVSTLLWFHVPVFLVIGILGPRNPWEAVGLTAGVAVWAALVNLLPADNPKARATHVSVGLIACTLVAIEITGGEMATHIHLYAVLIFVALYQQWAPLVSSIVVVVVHHGVLGLLAPERVFSEHHMGVGAALGMVAVHAGLLTLEVAGIVVFWHFAEQAERENELLAQQAEHARRDVEQAEHEARERAAEDLRLRSEESAAQARRVTTGVAQIGAEAHAAHAAVAAVDRELAALTASVRDIAERSAQAAGTASTGKDAAASAGEVKDLAREIATSVEKVNQVITAIVAETGDVAHTFASTTGAVDEIHELQLNIASSVEEQAAVLAEVTTQLSAATAAADQVLAGLETLSATAER